jgi:diadenosine tetraphosphate (Ap4A) HIT family hydrolase
MSASSSNACPFCSIPLSRVIDANDLALAIEDAFPVRPGHTLVVSRRHVESFFDLTSEEVAALVALLHRARARLDRTHHPDGYNIGINVGRAAGQTVMHLHIHLIPRATGDVAEPRGGVRNVIPGKGAYSVPDCHDRDPM